MRLFSIVFYILCANTCFSQVRCYQNLYFQEINLLIGRDKKGKGNRLNRAIKIRINKDTFAKINLFDCQGQSNLNLYSRRMKSLIVEGTYNSCVNISFDILQIDNIDYSIGYYIPIKNGIWKFYNNRKVEKIEFWNNGILDSTITK